MKNTDKITLTFGQLKKLVCEAKDWRIDVSDEFPKMYVSARYLKACPRCGETVFGTKDDCEYCDHCGADLRNIPSEFDEDATEEVVADAMKIENDLSAKYEPFIVFQEVADDEEGIVLKVDLSDDFEDGYASDEDIEYREKCKKELTNDLLALKSRGYQVLNAR